MTELEKSGQAVEAEVVEANRGGLDVDIGLRGFVPVSQLTSVGGLAATERGAVPDALQADVGKRLPLKVIEADQRRDGLILSEKAAGSSSGAGARRRHPQSSSKARCSRGRWQA
jgi:ribosomal protein S1